MPEIMLIFKNSKNIFFASQDGKKYKKILRVEAEIMIGATRVRALVESVRLGIIGDNTNISLSTERYNNRECRVVRWHNRANGCAYRYDKPIYIMVVHPL